MSHANNKRSDEVFDLKYNSTSRLHDQNVMLKVSK